MQQFTLKAILGVFVALSGPEINANDCPVKHMSTTVFDVSPASELELVGDVLYILGSKYATIDISNLNDPKLIQASLNPSEIGLIADAVVAGERWVYVAGTAGLGLLDGHDPENLQPVVAYSGLNSFVINGNRAYGVSDTTSSFVTFDMQDPALPQVLWKYSLPSTIYAIAPMAAFDSRYVLAKVLATSYGINLDAYDLIEPSNPVILSTVKLPTTWIGQVMMASVVGRTAYCVYDDGYANVRPVLVYDMGDVSKPKLIQEYSPPSTVSGLYFGVSKDILVQDLVNGYVFCTINADGSLKTKAKVTLGTNGNGLSTFAVRGDTVFALRKDGLRIYVGGECSADLDCSYGLDINDFIAFHTAFVFYDSAADCDEDGTLTIDDFVCFQTAFSAGC